MASVVEEGTPRTFLAAVQDCMRNCGMETPGSLLSPDRNVSRAMFAVNSSLNEIWYRKRWDWRFTWWPLPIEAGVMWYEVPRGFSATGSRFGVHKIGLSMPFRDYEWLISMYPYIRNMPTPFGFDSMEDEIAEASYSGTPTCWVTKGGYVGLWPPPSQDFIDQTSSTMIGTYYRNFIDLVDGADELGLSVDLEPAHSAMSLGVLQHYKEWPDWKITKDIGQTLLAQAVARSRQMHDSESQLLPEG
jgi:hypothetical protein